MTILNNFIIPFANILFILTITTTLLFIIGRSLYFKYKKYWKFYLKYRILKKELKNNELFQSIKDIDINKVKKDILLKGQSLDLFNEMQFLKTQGGFNNDRQTKRND